MAGIGYAFISAYLKGEEARMVGPDHLNAILKASGYQESVDAIRNTDIGTYLEGLDITTFDELDERLWSYFSDCLNRINWFNGVPDSTKRLVNSYATRYDIQNIKTALQGIITGIHTQGIPAGTIYNKDLLDALLKSETIGEITRILGECKLTEYGDILDTYRDDEGIRKESLTDTGLESLYYGKLNQAVQKEKDNSTLRKVINIIVDMTNLQIILRAVISESDTDASGKTIPGGYIFSESLIKELLSSRISDIPAKIDIIDYRTIVEEIIAKYDVSRNISVIDETIDKHKFTMIRDLLSPRIMSPAVAVWYLILKEIELRNVRLALKASLDNIPADNIRDYLVYTS